MNKNTPPDPDAIEETEPEAAVEAHPLRSVEEILEESLDARNDSPDDEDTASGSPAEEPIRSEEEPLEEAGDPRAGTADSEELPSGSDRRSSAFRDVTPKSEQK
ncbi:MAG TPA: hypothetical protein VHM91_09845 [Verrucomicrobiales bacterium]|jgi:hypothetical protein|nr:hypothetical protein [Verrucomicrobiales bacterium]